jgi:hypothetical protein
MAEVIGYNDYSTDDYVVSGRWSSARTHATNSKRFFFSEKLRTCPFCKGILYRVYHAAADLVLGVNGYEANVVHECSACGWWDYQYVWEHEGPGWEYADFEKKKLRGIAKRFDTGSIAVPLEVLNKEALKRPDILYETHPSRFEQLVGHVFSAFFSCEVVHCGKSNDGGVDLILVEAEAPVLVQVKRRADPDATESVSAVRDFLGAMTIKQARKGIFVSTAKRFSPTTNKIAAELVAKSVVDRFDLVDFDRFLAMLRTAGQGGVRPWEKVLRRLEVEHEHSGTLNLFVDHYDANARRSNQSKSSAAPLTILGGREPLPAFGSKAFLDGIHGRS